MPTQQAVCFARHDAAKPSAPQLLRFEMSSQARFLLRGNILEHPAEGVRDTVFLKCSGIMCGPLALRGRQDFRAEDGGGGN